MRVRKSSFSSAVTPRTQNWAMPWPMEAGVLGRIRMRGYSPPAMSVRASRVSPAAMLHSTKRSVRAARTGASSASTPAIIWGFTPRKIRSQFWAISPLPDTLARVNSPASFSALAGVRLDRYRTAPSAAPLSAARARAEPMLPVPIKPID